MEPTYRMAFSMMVLDGKLPPGDPRWREFNGSFVNVEVDQLDIARYIQAGHAFTTWHACSWRHGDNFQCGQHLGIDFDTMGVDKALEDSFVDRYASIVYATPSSTAEHPRCRALFLLDTPIMQAANYVRAATALIWLFGGQADRQCKDAARFFYGANGSMPRRRAGVLPLEQVKALILQAEKVQPPRHKRIDYIPGTPDAQDAQRLLDRLSPNRADDYGDWITVGMALHAGIGNEGLRMWEAWSSRSAKHVQGECERKWETFTVTGNGVTMATVGMWARQDTPS